MHQSTHQFPFHNGFEAVESKINAVICQAVLRKLYVRIRSLRSPEPTITLRCACCSSAILFVVVRADGNGELLMLWPGSYAGIFHPGNRPPDRSGYGLSGQPSPLYLHFGRLARKNGIHQCGFLPERYPIPLHQLRVKQQR